MEQKKPVNLLRITTFLAITFFLNWSMAFFYWKAGGDMHTRTESAVIFGIFYMIIPMSVAFSLDGLLYKKNILKDYGLESFNRRYLFAWLLIPILILTMTGISFLLPWLHFSPGLEGLMDRMGKTMPSEQIRQIKDGLARSWIHPYWQTFIVGLLLGPTVNAVVAFGEESGWRGFLQRELAPLGFWKMSLAIGFFWGLWHAPIILMGYNYPDHPIAGVWIMIGFTILLAPLFSFVRIYSGSVIAASIAHGTLNAMAGISYFIVRGGNDLTSGILGLPGFLTLILADIYLYLHIRKKGIQIPFESETGLAN